MGINHTGREEAIVEACACEQWKHKKRAKYVKYYPRFFTLEEMASYMKCTKLWGIYRKEVW